MTEEQQSNFSGWAVVEQMGHNKYAGFVTTQTFGQACLFRVDVPDLPERTFVLTQPTWTQPNLNGGQTWSPAGSEVKRASSPAYSKLIGPSSIFAITPCSEELVRQTLESISPRPLIELSRPATASLPPPSDEDDEEYEYDSHERSAY